MLYIKFFIKTVMHRT